MADLIRSQNPRKSHWRCLVPILGFPKGHSSQLTQDVCEMRQQLHQKKQLMATKRAFTQSTERHGHFVLMGVLNYKLTISIVGNCEHDFTCSQRRLLFYSCFIIIIGIDFCFCSPCAIRNRWKQCISFCLDLVCLRHVRHVPILPMAERMNATATDAGKWHKMRNNFAFIETT